MKTSFTINQCLFLNMFRLTLIVLLFVLNSCLGIDHNLFRNCSQVEFCNEFRTRVPADKYKVLQVDSISDITALITLKSNDGSDDLLLNITSLKDNTFRVKISEKSSQRYELQDVLNGEPEASPFTSTSQDDKTVTLESGDNKVIVQFSPLSLDFQKNGITVVKLDGKRLILNNKDSNKAYALGLNFPEAHQLYGIHEHADSIALQNTGPDGTDPYRLRNLDVPGYETSSTMANYGAIPVLYGHGPKSTVGVFLHNAAEQWYEINNSNSGSDTLIMVETGSLDLFVFTGPSPTEVVRQYVTLTGTAHLPQYWTLGYHQCRWNYDNTSDVKDVIANFDKYDFPLDAIWLDIEYTDGKRYFTWNPENFTDPLEMQQNISSTGRKLVTIIDPHIKVDQNYPVYKGALDADLFVKNPDGSNFEGDCWPGLSSYMDFLNPKARSYYADWYSYDKFQGSTPTLAGIWNDMNEPSVFNDNTEKTMPGDVVHYGGVQHRDIHNIYGLLHTMATHEGLMKRDQNSKRPFILTRSHFAGTQRYSAFWTGDNTADWSYVSSSYSECMNSNILGLVFCGADIGGFTGEPDEELLQRWYQAGVWLPFYRSHANLGSKRREPYLYSEEVQSVIRNALKLRYHHIPHWYKLFYEHTRNKDPVVRPLFYQYPQNENVFKIDNHLLVGSDILVRPVFEPGVTSVQVYFPGGSDEFWYSLTSKEFYPGEGFKDLPVDLKTSPAFYRSGSVVCTSHSVGRSTSDDPFGTLTLYVNLNKNNTAWGTYYTDDQESFNYINNNNYLYINFTAEEHWMSMEQIDDSNTDNLGVIIDSVVYNEMTTPPSGGKPGVYKQTVYTTDVNNKLLREQKFDLKKKVIIELPH